MGSFVVKCSLLQLVRTNINVINNIKKDPQIKINKTIHLLK